MALLAGHRKAAEGRRMDVEQIKLLPARLPGSRRSSRRQKELLKRKTFRSRFYMGLYNNTCRVTSFIFNPFSI
jgi:hypothetical protein